jgi:transcriptional regulator of NAD metabolism
MNGEERRHRIIERLKEELKPLSGAALAKEFGVSRQIIVQDIALLRAEESDIIATNRGYLIRKANNSTKGIFHVRHGEDLTRQELYAFVDNGGHVINTLIEHPVYGELCVDMFLHNRRDVDDFLKQISDTKAALLTTLTNGDHYHLIKTETNEQLDSIEQSLKDLGILISKESNR